MLGVFAAGRILNAKTARSQMIGGMTWGIGAALTEENHVDARYGSFVNQDLANYHVAVNADVGEMDVVFLHEDDPHGGPLGSKGVGELGICGAGAAIINAIHNATGARIHDFPATPDKLLATLEALDG
jgi:xanthine dehydrogenase YagR molybdenum-binding subunit